MRYPVPLLLAALWAAPLAASSQVQSGQSQSASPPGYTLNVSSQLVIEDVSVIDSKGRPVTGLPKSAFHVFDNNVPQPDFEFREQMATFSDSVPHQSNVYSNALLLTGKGTMVALLIDPMTVELQDQMYLRIQALRFIETLPAGASVAVFRTNNQGIPVELQSPTMDRALIREAIAASVPVVARPVDNQFQNAIAELENLSEVLRPYPGNKALLWLAGEFPLFVPPNYLGGSNDTAKQDEQTREAYRVLQEARIAVYPIDARGVVQQGGFVKANVMSQGDIDRWANDPSLTPPSLSQLQGDRYNAMDELASATGGFAFYDNNSVARVMDTALQIAQHSYTLSMRPSDTARDVRWHSVQIDVNGPYKVRYRTGYFANGATPDPGQQGKRPVLDPKLGKVRSAEIANKDRPIEFAARVVQGAPQGKIGAVNIRYVIPAAQLQFDSADGERHSRFRLVALAYNAWGDVLSHETDIVETRYSPDQMQLASRIGVPADQSLPLGKGALYLLLAVEDLKTKKVGTVQLSLASVQAKAAATQPAKP